MTKLRKNISSDGASSGKEFTDQLANRLRVVRSEVVTADEIEDWPGDTLDELVAAGILTEIEHAKGFVCRESEEHCFIEPTIRTYPGGKRAGVYVCCNPGVGRVEVELGRLRRWRIDRRKLWKMVYGFDSEWQMPWDDDASEYIGLQDAVNLANNDSITVKKMSRLLADPHFPVRRMRHERRCNVHLGDFRKWLQYAEYGKVTDKAIAKYLEGVEKRKNKTYSGD